MFHVKHPRAHGRAVVPAGIPFPRRCYHGSVNLPRALAAGLLAVVFVVTTAACGGVKNPEGWASPVVSDSAIYYFPKKDRLTALSVEADGTVRETWTVPNSTQQDPKAEFKAVYDAVEDDENLYFGSWDGALYAIAKADGAIRWSRGDRIAGGIVGGPVLAGENIVFGTIDGRVYLLDRETGDTASGWPRGGLSFSKGIYAAPVVSGEVVYVATLAGEVHAYRLADASPVWSQPFKNSGAIADLALIDEDRLFVPGLNKKVTIVSTADGSVTAGPFAIGEWIWSRPAVAGDVVYFGDFGGNVHALDITTGQDVWPPYDAGARIKSAPVIIGDVLIVATRDPEVHFIDRKSGQMKNSVPLLDDSGSVRAALVVRDGKALVATTKGKLFEADPARLAVTPLTIVSVGR